jgi:hypothetical protein
MISSRRPSYGAANDASEHPKRRQPTAGEGEPESLCFQAWPQR